MFSSLPWGSVLCFTNCVSISLLSQGTDPTANLTFDLRLSEREKMERSKVVLPYIRVGVAATDSKMSSARGGQVVYQLDEADDFDESDPDDDLDI